jgi:ribosome biogenesis GTPase / thiamine phosphate phosphatase
MIVLCLVKKGLPLDSYLDGLVVKEQSSFFWVEVESGLVYMCQLRGRLMEKAQSADIAAIGDRVKISVIENDESGHKGVIEAVRERRSVLSRAARTVGNRGGGDAEREHVIIANADAIFYVFAAVDPSPSIHLLDKMLVAGEQADIEDLIIVVNKIDLEDPSNITALFSPYEAMGYTVLYTSAKDGRGIEAIDARLRGKISAFTGPSGVGKTSLLNSIQPELGRQVKQVSDSSREGVHTTRDSALIKLNDGQSYLADTPGMRNLSVYDVEPEELDGYFRDIASFVDQCRFSDCSHTGEPGCAVRQAVIDGHISPRRYKSYRKLRNELEESLAAQYG